MIDNNVEKTGGNGYNVPYNYKNDELIEYIIKDIAKYSPITREEERQLFIEYKNPNTKYTRKEKIKIILIKVNMRFVLNYALKYKNFPIHLSDIISEGKLGLIDAIELFDIERNKKFISFAVWHIKSKVSKMLEESDLIKLPSHQKVKLNREKKNKEIGQFDDETRELFELTQPKISYDSFVGTNNDLKICDIIPDTSDINLEKTHLRTKIYTVLKNKITEKLSKDESTVITYLYGLETGEEMGLREVGDIICKSHERVRQLRDSALIKLRKNKEINNLNNMFFESIE